MYQIICCYSECAPRPPPTRKAGVAGMFYSMMHMLLVLCFEGEPISSVCFGLCVCVCARARGCSHALLPPAPSVSTHTSPSISAKNNVDFLFFLLWCSVKNISIFFPDLILKLLVNFHCKQNKQFWETNRACRWEITEQKTIYRTFMARVGKHEAAEYWVAEGWGLMERKSPVSGSWLDQAKLTGSRSDVVVTYT